MTDSQSERMTVEHDPRDWTDDGRHVHNTLEELLVAYGDARERGDIMGPLGTAVAWERFMRELKAHCQRRAEDSRQAILEEHQELLDGRTAALELLLNVASRAWVMIPVGQPEHGELRDAIDQARRLAALRAVSPTPVEEGGAA